MLSAGQSVHKKFHTTVGPERVYTPSNKISICDPVPMPLFPYADKF